MHPLWFYKHQHDNRVRSACQRWWFQWRFWFVPSFPGYTRTLSLETVRTTFEWNCQMVVVSRIWCRITAGQLYHDNHFEQLCIWRVCLLKMETLKIWIFPHFSKSFCNHVTFLPAYTIVCNNSHFILMYEVEEVLLRTVLRWWPRSVSSSYSSSCALSDATSTYSRTRL